MRWKDLRRSTNVVDRRGGGGMRGPGRIILPTGRGGRTAGIGGIGAVVLILIALFFGIDPSMILSGGGGGTIAPEQRSGPESAQEAEMRDFVSAVLGDTEETWNAIFQAQGSDYQEPQLVLFSGAVQSACGFADAAVGPFYCPPDRQVYLDTDFFADMERRLDACKISSGSWIG
jgi:predicted metalloprotease